MSPGSSIVGEDANKPMALGKPETFKNASEGNVSQTGCHRHIGYKKGMAIASLNVNGGIYIRHRTTLHLSENHKILISATTSSAKPL